MNPLIIIATPNICWLNTRVKYPRSPEEIAEEAYLCQRQGATILHAHAEGKWEEVIKAVRQRCEIIIQCGMSSQPIQDRMDIFKAHGDMISIILNHHDEAFSKEDFNVLHEKAELIEYTQLCKKNKVIPEWEVWHSGSIWNLKFLIKKEYIKPPFVTTLFFGWPGGTWSPPTLEEYLYRRKLMPRGCVCNVSIMDKNQRKIISAAIINGDHVRVGTEDYPYDHAGKLVSTHELVHEVAEIAHSLGRPLATIKEARKFIGLIE
jgi:3-keto-5-aminohexanoate cleavage enzyme